MQYGEYVDAVNKYYRLLYQICNTKESESKIKELSDRRKISLEELRESGIFYIDNSTKMLIPEMIGIVKNIGIISNTNNMPIFHDRYVIPIKDHRGNIVNFVGYSPIEEERYVYGTGEWYDRRDMFYGLENIDTLYKKGWGILLEGISDVWAIRQFGIKNVLGNCGTHFGETKKRQCLRLDKGLIIIPDRDRAGQKLLKTIDTPKQVHLYVPIKFKDFAETVEKLSEEELSHVKSNIGSVIAWVEENGMNMNNFKEKVCL